MCAHPKLRAWFACGDFRQRITRHGILASDELRWIAAKANVSQIEIRQIETDYRQSPRLRALAEALDSGRLPDSLPVDGDPLPLLAEYLAGEGLAAWLGDRLVTRVTSPAASESWMTAARGRRKRRSWYS